jgi:hypothetical protein
MALALWCLLLLVLPPAEALQNGLGLVRRICSFAAMQTHARWHL